MPETFPELNHNQITYSVSEVSNAVKRMVEERFGVVRIRGEITGFKLATSGHCYFRLKDDGAVIDAVCWRGTLGKLPFKPEDGLEVVASGKITTYPGKSSYQIVVDFMEPAGAGALMALLEKRKAQLAAEGLFAPERKKPLPYLPQTIGVITSPTGAVIRDILHRIADRFPVHVIVWPVAVQGEGAAEQIAAAIEGFNSSLRPDLLIVARGGGSMEDLWAFNEEIVVRAAANSRIPLISAVGHETDTTLIDYAADVRAPTPTAAAEMAVPVRTELLLMIKQLDVRLSQATQRNLAQQNEKLQGLARGLPKPSALLENATQRFDDWSERLQAALPQMIARKEQQLQLLANTLRPHLLLKDIQQQKIRVEELVARLQNALQRALKNKTDQLGNLASLLESMNVSRVLERGFALVRDEAGALVTNAKTAKTKSILQIQFHDGEVNLLHPNR